MKDDVKVIPGFDEAAIALATERQHRDEEFQTHIDLLNAVVMMLQFASDSGMKNGAVDRLRASYNAWKNAHGV